MFLVLFPIRNSQRAHHICPSFKKTIPEKYPRIPHFATILRHFLISFFLIIMATSSNTNTNTNSNNNNTSSPTLSTLEHILTLEKVCINIYRGTTPKNTSFYRIYGGQTIAQALRAAGYTVNNNFIVHSLHSYFILPGNPDIPILYHIDRVRDGKSFCSRFVKATQNGDAIFTATISFQKYEQGLEFSDTMPQSTEPDALPTVSEIVDIMHNNKRLGIDIVNKHRKALALPFPIDARNVTDPYCLDMLNKTKTKPYSLTWLKTIGNITNDLFLHQCAIAYLSDWNLLRVATQPHGLNAFDGSAVMASLDHSMWFHAPFRADEWLLYECVCPRTTGGRALCFGKMYSKDGNLVVSVAQEGVVRVNNNKGKLKSPKSDTKLDTNSDSLKSNL